MHIPAIPENEPQRLQALHGRALLDTPAEERFDRLTRLARNMLGIRIALVSLVDTDRQWFKSRQGLDACETGRDISFCGHAILDDAIFEITDARLDPRFADNPLVTGPPHIRFYAGAPLATVDGYRIGTLCIIDDQPRQLTAAERSALRDLADCVEAEINQIDLQQQSKALKKAQQLGEVIARAQLQFIREADRRRAFEGLLTDVLALTESEYGFVGEVLRTPEGDPYLKSWAITNIAWNDATRAFYDTHAPQGMEFTNLKTLFGAVMTSDEPVIANNPYHDPRRGGLPEGHPALNAFLGIPVHHGGEMVAMLGIANRPGGYDQALIDFLHPLLVTLGQLVEAARVQQKHREGQVELARLSRVASQTTNGVVITDADGRVEWINEGFTRISGYALDEMRGRKPGEILQGEATDPATVARMHEALRMGEPFDVDVINYSKSGEPYWINISCNPLRDGAGQLQGFMAIESDISERKRMERMKSEFVSTVSHELRTPLTSISGALGLVAGGVLGELPEQAKQMIAIAHKNSQRLGFLINDLLDMEKIAAGKLHFEMRSQPLMPLIGQALEANRPYGAERRVALVLMGEAAVAEVRVDSQRLMQVLANLLSNAIKFSPEGGTVEVTVQVIAGKARVAVADHGPGIPASFRASIFQKFSQADASDTRQKGGTGLGLAITRELVERMGGSIGFESVEGEGATFFFELPLWHDNATDMAAGSAPVGDVDAPRILVVEDEPDIAQLLGLMLTRAGYQVDLAGTGAEALRALQQTHYAAVSLDLMLPDISGLEIIRQVRQRSETADLPIVVVSAKMEEGRLAINGDFSGIDWLVKPIDENRLLFLVDRLVSAVSEQHPRVLHVEDDPDLHEVIRAMVGGRFDFVLATTLSEARARVALERFDVVILDLSLPDGSGWDLLPDIRQRQPDARVIILSGTDMSADETRKVEAVLLKSQVSPRELLDALSTRIQSFKSRGNDT